ncbi:LuxR C-terminal-related transcriptional regulator [Gordonia sp. 'Campus']|uniref:helix-turn-helix transcriptional regulator n=1 Tax=Gordonia sp. 'Campus' TaxID=2915824 RepID=UPI001EE404F5|nr:LuxR C-terminal-related transcriptional regulator [Gordonia sp. 'Campus']
MKVATRSTGRRAVVGQLRDAVVSAQRDPRSSRLATCVITAGPGAGKTHTLHELVDAAEGVVRQARADELSWRQPFAVAAALLGVELPVPVPDGYEDQLYTRVDDLCATGPLVLVVDDAHHADAATLELLTRLVGATRVLPLVLLVGRRPLPERDLLHRLVARVDVGEWSLPPLDDDEVRRLAAEFTGAVPDDRLTGLLMASGGNPMHVISVVRGLQRSGGLRVENGRVSVEDTAQPGVPQGLRDAIAEHLALLDGRARELVQKLAVWGGPATLAQLAAVDAVPPASLVGAAQSTIDAGIVTTDDTGALRFTHDLYADVTYEQVNPMLRSVLHDAMASHPSTRHNSQSVAHHRIASGTDEGAMLAAVRRAESELANTPSVAAELLETLSERTGRPAAGVHVALAGALARTGQLNRASQVAEEGLAAATEIADVAALHRVLLFALTARGDTDRVRHLIDETLQLPVGDDVVTALTDLRRYVGILDGRNPAPSSPFLDATDDLGSHTVAGLIAEALRRFVRGEVDEGLRLALMASRRDAQEAEAGTLSTSSAEIWPSLIGQYAHGPAAAADLLTGATRLRASRGTDWMTAYHEFIRGGIALGLGELDDAAASFDAGLERADSGDMGWKSMAVGGRAMIDVLRGDLASASTRLNSWEKGGLPDQFGFPVPLHARSLLLEANRKLRAAATSATTAWDHGRRFHLYGWLPTVSLGYARIGVRAGDRELLSSVEEGLDDLPGSPAAPARGLVAVAQAMCRVELHGDDPATISAAATEHVEAMQAIGDRHSEACLWEEAARAAAITGNRARARELAREALRLNQSMGATTSSARIATRLRPLGVRIDPAVRDRPVHGWESLTKTETTVAELVAAGMTGSEIADRLYISTRTVQTHVSHALAKLGVRTRVELAAFVVSRRAGAGRDPV